jgi:hypothetical protein
LHCSDKQLSFIHGVTLFVFPDSQCEIGGLPAQRF